MRTKYGSEIHQGLLDEAVGYMRRLGYQVKRDFAVGKKRVDVAGFKGGEKVAVECMVKVFNSVVSKRIKEVEGYFDKIIFFVPKDAHSAEVPSPHEFVFSESFASTAQVNVKINTVVYTALLRLQGFLQLRDGKRYTIDDVLRDILYFASESNKYRGELVPLTEDLGSNRAVFHILPEEEE